MSRLIDADALKEKIERTYINGIKLSSVNAVIVKIVNDLISDAPTIELPQWTPCSERLPEYLEEVLMSTFWGVRVGFRDHTERSGDFWNIIENDSTVAPHSVYAWMPLPKPYEETDYE